LHNGQHGAGFHPGSLHSALEVFLGSHSLLKARVWVGAQELLVMRLQQEERAGRLGSMVGDTPVAGLKQHELLEWYFDHQTERCALPCTV
jgi:hypothetical protein